MTAAMAGVVMSGCEVHPDGRGGPSIEIDGPVSPAFTNGVLTFQVDVSGHPARVELRKDGALLTELAYPYLWAWDTHSTPEGSYTIIAVALDGAGRTLAQSAPVEVTVDRTPPAVLARAPAPGAEEVDVYGAVTVELDEPVTLATASHAQITFAAGNPVTGASLSADGRTLTLPSSSAFLPVPNIASVDLSGVRDRAGNPVDAGTWTYRIPAWLSLGSSDRVPAADAAEPAIAVREPGRPVVAFLEDAGGSRDLQVSGWDGAAWVPLGGPLDFAAGDEVASPALAIEPDTRLPVAAWIEWDGATPGAQRQLRAARWSGSVWEPLGPALNATTGDAGNPVLVIGSGGPTLAWNEAGAVRVARWTGAAWTALGAATTPAGTARGGYLAAEGGGTWLVYRAPDASIRAASLQGGSWVAKGIIATAGRDDLSITWDETFQAPVVALMEEIAPADYRLAVREWDLGGGWYDLTFIGPTASPLASDPRLANGHVGTGGGIFPPEDGLGAAAEPVPPQPSFPSIQIAWQEDGDVHAAVLAFFEWQSLGIADREPSAAAAHPALADDGDRGVFAAWHEEDGGTRSVRIGRVNRR